jgi:hypothetical protein
MDSEEVLGRQFASRPYKQLGEFLRKQRLAGGETLRAFCKRTGRDAGRNGPPTALRGRGRTESASEGLRPARGLRGALSLLELRRGRYKDQSRGAAGHGAQSVMRRLPRPRKGKLFIHPRPCKGN